MDTQMGRVLDALEKSPHADDTIVVLLTDHGFHLGEKHRWQKATLWEEATHVLLTIRVPGITSAGGVSNRFVSLLDLYPTLNELCGLKAATTLDGRSLVPLLKDPDANWKSTAITGLTSKRGPVWKPYISVRTTVGRYTRYQDGEEEFYDTTADPNEWTNQIANPRYAETIKGLRGAVPTLTNMAAPLPNQLESGRRKGR